MSFVSARRLPLASAKQGPRATVEWDFTRTRSVAPAMTFTRASIKNACRAGLLASFAVNEPAVEEDPITGVVLGILLEGQASNICPRGQLLDNANWTKSAVTVTADAAAAPDGTTTADEVEETNANGVHYTYNNSFPTIATTTAYTWSIFRKAAERNWVWTSAYDGNEHRSWFDLTNGVVGTSDSGNTALIRAFPSEWYRCTVSRTTGATTSSTNGLGVADADNVSSYQGVTGSGAYAWGAEIVAGSYPTSVILTVGGATITRSADVLTLSRPGVAHGAVRITGRTAQGAGTQVLWQWDDGTQDNRLTLYRDSSRAIHFEVVSGGVSQADITLSTVADNTGFVAAASWSTDAIFASLNGGAVGSDTSAAVPTGLTTQRFGANSVATSWDGHIGRYATFENQRVGANDVQRLAA